MNQRFFLFSVVSGAGLTLIGFVGDVIMFFKPWASCDYDTVSAACAATELEALLFMVFFCLFLAGSLILALSLVYWLKKDTQSSHSDDEGGTI